jgi:hypothetical protein
MKFFKEIYYYFLYGQFLGKGYSRMIKLDILLVYLEEIGVKSILKKKLFGLYGMEIIFNDNTKFKFRYSEDKSIRWYGFMGYGKIEFSNGKELKWDYNMPSYEILYKYKRIINKNIKDTDDYTEYLPLRLLRKLKLKKLKNKN